VLVLKKPNKKKLSKKLVLGGFFIPLFLPVYTPNKSPFLRQAAIDFKTKSK